MKLNARIFFVVAVGLAGIALSALLIGCGSSKPAEESAPTRYTLNGRVVSVDKAKQQVTVDGEDIPGFMSAMEMAYSVKNPSLLDPLSPEDKIKADVVVTDSDVWLENIVVVKKPDQAKPAASNESKPAPPPAGKQN